VNGILVTVLIVSGVNLLINLSIPIPGFLSFLTLLLFFNDFSVRTKSNYGFIFSFASHLVGFCSFANRLGQDSIFRINTFRRFYLIVSLIFFYISNRYAELQIAECKLTSKYLQLEGLMGIRVRPKTITKKQLNLQVQLNTIHENIREILIRNRTLRARLIKIENYYSYLFH
jgi:hypothetical protein